MKPAVHHPHAVPTLVVSRPFRLPRFRLPLLIGVLLAVIAAGTPSPAAIPPGYYSSADTSSPTALRDSLHEIIDDHTRYPYTSGSWDTWNILELAWEDPNNSGRILDVYKNASYQKYGAGNTEYNREHVWPKSYGFPDDGSGNYPYTDCHGLALCDDSYNTSRSNKPFRNCSAACTEKTTLYNNGVGGGSGTYPGNSNWTSGAFASGTWETWHDKRGDIARSMLYFDVRYEGGTHGVTGYWEPDLILTDSEALIAASNTGSNITTAYMGMLDVLLDWHDDDPVDANEMARNDVIYTYQGNRNPFVDHPEWVDAIWRPSPSGPPSAPWINEIHYDNIGDPDTGEFVEIAGPDGLDLTGWDLVAYNGSTGTEYDRLALSGVIPLEADCLGTLFFSFPGLQNGSPDGLALVDSTGSVVEFLSYEGTFTANDGPALGLTSSDIVVSEDSGTPVGHSLQLGGVGSSRASFSWNGAQTDTPGSENSAQTFLGGCPVVTTYGCGVNPSGSLWVISGLPRVGTQMVLALHNPVGTQAPGSITFLFASLVPDPNFPCGTSIPGYGMGGAGAYGEILIGIAPPEPRVTVIGTMWNGFPATATLSFPADPNLVGLTAYGQGVIIDPTMTYGVKFGLTEAAQMPISY